MAAVDYDLVIERGASYNLTIEWRENDGSSPPTGPLVDTSDYSARLRIWSSIGDTLATLSPLVDDGVIEVHIDGAQRIHRAASYELVLYKTSEPSDIVRLAQGSVTVLSSIVPPTSPLVITHDATTLIIVSNGRGPAGPTGPPGSGGEGSGAAGHKHDQQETTTVWDIEHNLGYDPAGVYIVALNGDVWLPVTLTYPTPGQIARVTFPTSIAGTAWLS